MRVDRIIGVDFGTSTSVIRVKRYQNGQPVGDRLTAQAVSFDMGSSMVPTLIQKVEGNAYYGFDAQTIRRKSTLYQNFKMDLENPDVATRELARELTKEFLAYLAKAYQAQSEGGHLGDADDCEHTYVSYPVKWSDETKRFMIEAARAAGFPDVIGMDEAQAAIQTVVEQNAEALRKKRFFDARRAPYILLADMGAGTTDLILCQRSTTSNREITMLCTWPQHGEMCFGGRELDELLYQYVRGKLPQETADAILARCGLEKFKAWKETVVSPALKTDGAADQFSQLDMITDMLGIDMGDYTVTRKVFEKIAADYLVAFPALVKGCLKAAGVGDDQIDLAILTGGHSQWYFVMEQLCGRMDTYGKIDLKKIKEDPTRVLSVSLPQETVALGLAYSGLKEIQDIPLVHVPEKKPTCTEYGHREYWYHEESKALYTDPSGTKEIQKADWEKALKLSATGHSYSWVVEQGERRMKCVACGDIKESALATQATAQSLPKADVVKKVPISEEETPESEFSFSNMDDGYVITKYIGDRSRVIIPAEIRGRKIKAVGDGAFSVSPGLKKYWGSLTYVQIPETVRVIGNRAFEYRGNLQHVDIRGDIDSIGKYAFYGCCSLKTIVFHGEVREIGKLAFCTSSVGCIDFGQGDCPPHVFKLPKGLKRIAASAFSSAKEVTMSKQTEVYGSFSGKLKDVGAIFYYED